MPESDSRNELDLYLCDGLVTTVRNPVRLKILNLLKTEGAVSFCRIQEETSLSKSTLSGYLTSLSEAGLVERVSSEGDGRRKYYRLLAKNIGAVTPSSYSASSEYRELIRKTITNCEKFDFKEMMPHIFRVALAEAGIQLDPVIRHGGEILGESIAPFIVSDTLEKTIKNISDFWKRYGMGDFSMKSEDPLVVEVKNCYECMTLPSSVTGGCIITTGVFSAIFSIFYKKMVNVTEIQCMANNFPACCFKIMVPLTP